MQLFSLVNTLLSVDPDSFKRRLHIQRYPVIPLAPNAGLLGWVQESDTLHVLVRDYRESRKVLLNIEYRLMLQVSKVTCAITYDSIHVCRWLPIMRTSHSFRKLRCSSMHWRTLLARISIGSS